MGYALTAINAATERCNQAITIAENCRKAFDGLPTTGAEVEALNTKYNTALEDAYKFQDEVERMLKHNKLETWRDGVGERVRPLLPSGKNNEKDAIEEKSVIAYKKYLSGQHEMNGSGFMRTPEWDTYAKAYQADNPAGGGYLVTPQILANQIITLLKDLVFVRGLATVYPVPNAESLGVPAIDTDPADSDWTSELAVGSEETTLVVGKRELRPSPLAKYIKMSKKLLRQVPNADAVILDRLLYKVGITEEKAFLTGTGNNQPLGVFTASSMGISTARDTTCASSTVFTASEIISMFFNLKAGYRNNATWIIHRSVISLIRQLKDSNNNFLFTAGWDVRGGGPTGPGGGLQGTPNTLLARPIMESEYAPSTMTTGLYTMIVGDFSRYWIADALDITIQVLYEYFATTNQMGYILRKETDGMPVLEEAFQRLKLA